MTSRLIRVVKENVENGLENKCAVVATRAEWPTGEGEGAPPVCTPKDLALSATWTRASVRSRGDVINNYYVCSGKSDTISANWRGKRSNVAFTIHRRPATVTIR